MHKSKLPTMQTLSKAISLNHVSTVKVSLEDQTPFGYKNLDRFLDPQ